MVGVNCVGVHDTMIEVELGARVGTVASCGTSVQTIMECDIICHEYN